MMPDETRQVRPDELRARLFRALRSLERGLIAIDDGDASGYDDALRAIRLLALSGRGNGLLLRVAAQDSIELPKICITPPAESVPDAEEPLVFAMGAIPAEGVPRPSDPRWPEQLVSLTELLHQRVLYLDGSIAPRELGGSARLSWEELLVLLANKMGASHVDDKVPLVFDEICRYCFVDGIHPLAFAVRSFGVVLLRLGSVVSSQLGGGSFSDRPLMVGTGHIWIGELHWYGHIGGMVNILINVVSKAGTSPNVSWERLPSSRSWP